MINIDLLTKTPKEISGELSARLRKRRKEAKLTQSQLSERSGVSLGSLKRFETKGEISLKSLIKLAIVLECEEDFDRLFSERKYKSIQEIIDEQL